MTNRFVQQTLMGEAIATAAVGFLVWDDERRYVAANTAACELLGCTLERIIGVDGGGTVVIEYVTFSTRAAGLPYMASLIWRADEG